MNKKDIISSVILLTILLTNTREHSVDYQWFIIFIIYMYLFLKSDKNNKKYYVFFIILLSFIRVPVILVLFHMIGSIKGYNWVSNNVYNFYDLCFNININKLPLSIKYVKHPRIFMCNYPPIVFQYSLVHILSDKICIVAAKHAAKIISTAWKGVKIINVDKKKNGNFKELHNKTKKMIQLGYDIMVYPERRNIKDPVNNKGMFSGYFNIAKDLNIEVTPVVFGHVKNISGLVFDNKLQIYVGKPRSIINISKEMKYMSTLYTNKLKQFSI